jgi:hypothetical protein
MTTYVLNAQRPPRPVTVTPTAQILSFGAFYAGPSGGTVTVSSAGIRSSTGSVVLLGLGYPVSAAAFDVVGNPGTLITILSSGPVTLSGSNGGSLTLNMAGTSPVSPFVLHVPYPGKTKLYVGGTLTVGNSGSNPPGAYNGTITIIFNQN